MANTPDTNLGRGPRIPEPRERDQSLSRFEVVQGRIEGIESTSPRSRTIEQRTEWLRLTAERGQLFAERGARPVLDLATGLVDDFFQQEVLTTYKDAAGSGDTRDEKRGARQVATFIESRRAALHESIGMAVDPLKQSQAAPRYNPARHEGMARWHVERALDRMYATFMGHAGIDLQHMTKLDSALRPADYEWQMPEGWEAAAPSEPARPEPTRPAAAVGREVGRGGPSGRINVEPTAEDYEGATRLAEETEEEFRARREAVASERAYRRAQTEAATTFGRRGTLESYVVERTENPDPAASKLITRETTRRWGIPDMIRGGFSEMFPRDTYASEVFSLIASIGFGKVTLRDRQLMTFLTLSNRGIDFEEAAFNGLVPLLALKGLLGFRRMDDPTLAGIETVWPDGLTSWMKNDLETKKCFTLILQLKGYRIAGEPSPDRIIPGLQKREIRREDYIDTRMTSPWILEGTSHSLADIVGGRGNDPDAGITDQETQLYKNATREGLRSQGIHVDPGILDVALVAAQYFFTGDQNNKVAELRKEMYDPQTEEGDIASKSLLPFIDTVSSEDTVATDREGNPIRGDEDGKFRKAKLREVLEKRGMDAFLQSITTSGGMEANKFWRAWRDRKLLLDFKDAFTGIRKGEGPDGSTLDYDQRDEALAKLFEGRGPGGVLQIKHVIEQDTIDRVLDPRKISTHDKVTYVSKGRREVAAVKGLVAGTAKNAQRVLYDGPISIADGISRLLIPGFGARMDQELARRKKEKDSRERAGRDRGRQGRR